MGESGYYPEGAEYDRNAPWNEESDNEAIDVNITVSYSLSKNTSIPVHHYTSDEWVDYEDETGHTISGCTYKFDDTNFESEYHNSKELGIPELLEILRNLAKEKALEASMIYDKPSIEKWGNIRKSCEDWIVDDFTVVED